MEGIALTVDNVDNVIDDDEDNDVVRKKSVSEESSEDVLISANFAKFTSPFTLRSLIESIGCWRQQSCGTSRYKLCSGTSSCC